MKNRKGDDWFPFWIDKWIFGSTRIELLPDERGVWVDLLSLSKKDNGFIRANENMPYLPTQLSGLLNIPLELYERTIAKCLKYEKIRLEPDGTYFILSTEKYELGERHKRRIRSQITNKPAMVAEKPAMVAEKPATKSRAEQEQSRGEENRKEQAIDQTKYIPNSEEHSKTFILLKSSGLPEKLSRSFALLLPYKKLKEIVVERAFTQNKTNPAGYLRRAVESELKQMGYDESAWLTTGGKNEGNS